MLPKPPTCQGCPMYCDGYGFVPDALTDSEVLVVAQNPGADEEAGRRVTGFMGREALYVASSPQPMTGRTGYQLRRTFLPLGMAEDASLANVLKCRWQRNGTRTNELPTGATLKAAVAHCMAAHFTVPPQTRLIVAHGGPAWEALGGQGSISAWRGHLSPDTYLGRPVYATLHTADLFREPRMDLVARRDWARLPRILDGTWPEQPPPTLTVKPSTLPEWEDWLDAAMGKPWVALDTEYNPDTKELWLLGLGAEGLPVAQLDWYKQTPRSQAAISEGLSILAGHTPIVMHNALADVPVLEKALGLPWEAYARIEDTMQLHAVLWSELPHDLEFLASLYGRYPKMKHLRHTDPLAYHKGDVLETMSVWGELESELRLDPASKAVYLSQLRLLPHLDRSMSVGIAVNQQAVLDALTTYTEKAHEAQLIAEAYCGYPIPLTSDAQVSHWCYTVEGMPTQKHRKTRRPTIDKDAVAVLRGRVLPLPADESPDVGQTVERIEQGGHALLEARALHGNAEQCVTHYLTPLMVAT